MRKLVMLCVFVSVGLLTSGFSTANAGIIWSSSASLVSKDTGVRELAPSSINDTVGEPDAVSWRLSTQLASPAAQVKNVTATWNFAGGVDAVSQFFGEFKYTNAANAVTAQIVSYTSGATTTGVAGTVVTLPKITGNTRVVLPFSLPGTGTDIDAVTVKFTMTGFARFNLDAFGTPEPGTFALFGAGLLGMGIWARRRRKRKAS